MKIAITGEKGFIGTHLTHYFRNILKYEVIELGRDYLDKLALIDEIDWLIHGACIHRHVDPEKVLEINREIDINTLNCLINSNLRCNITLLSSIHEDSDTPYGQSKREAKKMFKEYCQSIDTKFISFKMPNVFGKYAVPYKTSFVANFCYNLHNELPIYYNQNKITLCHIDEVVKIISKFKVLEFPYTETSVDEVYFLLLKFKEVFLNNEFPVLNSKLELNLYQTYLDYANYKL